jgi:hypothetical protein
VFKKLKFHLQLWDGIWSVPLAMLAFLGAGIGLQLFFTDPSDPQGGPGFYDPSFIQASIYGAALLVFMNLVAWLGIYFNFRGLWRYFYGTRTPDGTVTNLSKEDFKNLKPWQRLGLLLFIYLFFMVALLLLITRLM